MSKFRKKSVVIEATQWFKLGDHDAVKPYRGDYGWVETLGGGRIVTPGDWVITDPQGHHCPCNPVLFDALYEKAD